MSDAYTLITGHLQEHIPSGTPQGSLAFHQSIFPSAHKATLQAESPHDSTWSDSLKSKKGGRGSKIYLHPSCSHLTGHKGPGHLGDSSTFSGSLPACSAPVSWLDYSRMHCLVSLSTGIFSFLTNFIKFTTEGPSCTIHDLNAKICTKGSFNPHNF